MFSLSIYIYILFVICFKFCDAVHLLYFGVTSRVGGVMRLVMCSSSPVGDQIDRQWFGLVFHRSNQHFVNKSPPYPFPDHFRCCVDPLQSALWV